MNFDDNRISLGAKLFDHSVGAGKRTLRLYSHILAAENREHGQPESSRFDNQMIPSRTGGRKVGRTAYPFNLGYFRLPAALVPDVITQRNGIYPTI